MIDLFGIESSIINHPYTIFQIIRLSFMCVVLVFVSFCVVSFTRYSSRLVMLEKNMEMNDLEDIWDIPPPLPTNDDWIVS